MKVFIMAQGKGSRWEPTTFSATTPADFKQLIPLGDETIMGRTLRMLDGYDVTLITWGIVSMDFPDTKAIQLPESKSILHGIWSIKDLYQDSDRAVILLGDVVYSINALSVIMNDERELSLYGRRGSNRITGKEAPEIFGLSVRSSAHARLSKKLVGIKDSGEKLWDLYGTYGDPGMMVEIDDYTDDVDSLEEYAFFFDKLSRAALEDK